MKTYIIFLILGILLFISCKETKLKDDIANKIASEYIAELKNSKSDVDQSIIKRICLKNKCTLQDWVDYVEKNPSILKVINKTVLKDTPIAKSDNVSQTNNSSLINDEKIISELQKIKINIPPAKMGEISTKILKIKENQNLTDNDKVSLYKEVINIYKQYDGDVSKILELLPSGGDNQSNDLNTNNNKRISDNDEFLKQLGININKLPKNKLSEVNKTYLKLMQDSQYNGYIDINLSKQIIASLVAENIKVEELDRYINSLSSADTKLKNESAVQY